jgi:hypothetical protein
MSMSFGRAAAGLFSSWRRIMSLLDDAMNGDLIVIRDGKEKTVNGSINGGDLIASIDADVKFGDIVRAGDHSDEYVVTNVKRNKIPGRASRLDHLEAKVIPRDEWEAKNRRENVSQVTQHIGSAGIVAGRDVHLTLNASTFLQHLEAEIQNNPAIPAEEKKTWMSRIKDLATNPAVWESIVKVLGDLNPKGQ